MKHKFEKKIGGKRTVTPLISWPSFRWYPKKKMRFHGPAFAHCGVHTAHDVRLLPLVCVKAELQIYIIKKKTLPIVSRRLASCLLN